MRATVIEMKRRGSIQEIERPRTSIPDDDRISRESGREGSNELMGKKQVWGGIGKKNEFQF